jgi:hypothetical protein
MSYENTRDALRLQLLLSEQQQAETDENGNFYKETSAIFEASMKTYLIENHQLFVKAIEEYSLTDRHQEFKEIIVFHILFGDIAFTEFVVENNELDELTVESIYDEMSENEDIYTIIDELVEIYHELCNPPFLK